MPPSLLRRPLTVTAWLVLSIVCLTLSPLLLLVAGVASLITRRPQPLLLARLAIEYFARELGVLLACGVLWLLSGFGLCMRSPAMQRRHHELLRWFVHGLVELGVGLLRIDISVDSGEAGQALERSRPLLWFSRHAGPFDTVLLVDLLAVRYERLPSIVFKDLLTIDPSVDLIGHRLPHAVLDTSDPEDGAARIEQVSRELEPRGALLLFPEGANFTRERRRRALGKLWRKGLRREAGRAQRMPHVLPPRPGGVVAALRGNPQADVIFTAHTGLGLAAFPKELWRRTPIGQTFKLKMWLAGPEERPTDPGEQVKWLYDWWRRLDEWVEGRGEE